jgi:hypothetical protein
MSTIDKQRITAVRAMEALGHTFDGIEWTAPTTTAPSCAMVAEADAMHTLLVLRADKLAGCTEGSDEEAELKMIADTVSAYEEKRWPDGCAPGGKG